MELLLAAAAGIAGIAAFLQSKAPLPTEADFKKAQEKLVSDPGDPDASKVAGKYLSFVLGDYEKGIPLLAVSSDKTLKALADHELDKSYVATPLQQIGMGDEWIAAAKTAPALNKIYYDHAAQAWYSRAWPALDGVWLDKTREQLRKLFQNPAIPDPRTALAPTGWKLVDANVRASQTSKSSRNGKMSFQVAAGKNPAAQYVVLEQTLTAAAGKYKFSAWVLSDGTDSAKDQVTAVWFGQGSKMLGFTELTVPQDQPWWHHLETTFDVPPGAAILQIHIAPSSKAGNLYFDDISLKYGDKELVKNGSFEDR